MATIWEGSFMDVDTLTMSTIVQMQIKESEELTSNVKGKQREGTMTDAQMALQMYMEDLRSCDATLKDRKMAQSIAVAVLQDGALIHEAYIHEQQVARDRELAASLSANYVPIIDSERPQKMQKRDKIDPWSDPEMLAKVAAIYMQQPDQQLPSPILPDSDSDAGTIAESSTRPASHKTNDKPARRICVACGDEKDFFEVARVPCNHEYCRPCLESLFTLSMKDETLFPPRCDGINPTFTCQILLAFASGQRVRRKVRRA
ncbi:hypothetical protein LTR37_015916 [Vermiconidia calcicola]|uniref:Uncharacterized protein n=1 Tax=Vermiconidia calcicola TaxID=1690605 RepID=A0ACC3MPE5_9PEZI|nr:hypothetical protein LTR37_015916 [Vermiconidia calcicola]